MADDMLFRPCQLTEFMNSILGDTTNFLERAAAFVLWDPTADYIASEALSIQSRGYAKMAAFKNPVNRDLGLSTLLCSQLIQLAVALDLQPA
ncbi:hypothetical protein WL30_05680 [Burkholderia ubonensis]|uniref:Uncharacterized protein n=2 Tax=Burkholderia ubonensis TaxID=101571 RepID=A0ABD4DWG5_9BURK|nr:hypothetical protein WJ51_19020 [Burkholderia ubonensis]KVN76751.1 hypothetical protein WJ68_25195 [Burkholderia ubonensis]KVO06682.1 hypothetical protein WJ71_08085 [Burkholderia ubonensis]KVO09473.1 hypothetical protein WJ73_23510 [Burkholderia ubonensis]KVO90362.1 hypothetical protein WJ80_03340 [Burkholderia ubonensis]